MLEKEIRKLLADHAKLPVDVASIGDDTDLYSVGLTSLTTVNIMLAIEDHFDIEFDDSMLARATFQSVNALASAVEELLEENGIEIAN